MKKISVALATFNEEDNIGKCLKSVQSLASEIVIVDGSSQDKTVKIAKRFGAKVKITSNLENFHINKQKALDLSSGDWILQLDADEIVTERLKKEIIERLQKNPNENGFWLPRKNMFLGKFLEKGGQYPDYTLRLYRKGKGRLPCKSVHEQAKVQGQTGYLKNPLLHYPYPDFSHYLDHFNLYTSIIAKELDKEKTSLSAISFVHFMYVKPLFWFLSTYIRHKGFMDGFAGFVFSCFSSLRFPVSYVKYWEKIKMKNKNEKIKNS